MQHVDRSICLVSDFLKLVLLNKGLLINGHFSLIYCGLYVYNINPNDYQLGKYSKCCCKIFAQGEGNSSHYIPRKPPQL
jgi:hypothetical protein